MALSDTSSQTYIQDEMEAVFGVPQDQSRNDDFTLALAKAINKILKNDVVVNVSTNGVQTGGSTLPGVGALT